MLSARIIVVLLVLLLSSCKQRTNRTEQEESAKVEKERIVKILPKTLKEFGEFAGVIITDSTDIDQIIAFKKITQDGVISAIEMNQALSIYKKMMQPERQDSWPIFEIKNTNMAILPIKGIGYGGVIWAKVLVDRNTLEINKIEFNHQAESEGYGAAITQSVFEEKFKGAKVDFEKNTFILNRNVEKRIDDGVIIDVISGATMTSEAALEMVNYGLRRYKNYLKG
ncbi:FMN-binding protein [Spongiivirga sp. MCCC 1A20706]|uniref:FMN-binding protein n=1 Tax=Spongiivirga sp. MCCC 1A20706 TaxID=3160963 RepID=UPI0039772ABF